MNDLTDYIKKVKQKGMSNEKIFFSLKDAGWPQNKIDEAFKLSGMQLNTSTPPPKKKKGLPGWAIALIVIGALFILAIIMIPVIWSGLLDTHKYIPEKCIFGNIIHCVGLPSTTSSGIQLALRNGYDLELNLQTVEFTDDSDCKPTEILVAVGTNNEEWTSVGNTIVPIGELLKIKAACELEPGKIIENTVNLGFYVEETGESHPIEGTIKVMVN